MRTQIALLVSFLLILTSVALGQSFIYEKSIAAQPGPYPIAIDANGGIYYGTFNGASSGAYYIADPLNAASSANIDTYSSFPDGRGLQGISVDPDGTVYVTGDTGTDGASIFKKYGPAPSFTPDGGFTPDIATARILGNSWYGVNGSATPYLFITTFNSLRFYDAADASYDAFAYINNQSNYQRDVTVNPDNYDIYVTRNGQNVEGAVDLWYGGDPDNLASYTNRTMNLVTGLAPSDLYGYGSHGISYYAERQWLLVDNKGADSEDDLGTLDFYAISGSGASTSATYAFSVDGSESGTPLADNKDSVMFKYGDGTERLFITDTDNDRILVYKLAGTGPTPTPPSSAHGWQLYQ